MDSFEKIRWKKITCFILTYGIVIGLGILCVIMCKKYMETNSYYIPEMACNVEQGIPQLELEELNPKENIRIGFHHPVSIEDDKLYLYLTNYKENEVAISAFLYDEEQNLYADSGMIMREQYLPYLQFHKEIQPGKEYYINVAFYNAKDMTSEGSIWIRIGKISGEK